MRRTSELRMGMGWWWLCVLGIVVAPCGGIRQCLDGITINVILLDDEESPWSLKFVKDEIVKAIETDSAINAAEDVGFNLTANFGGFKPTFYRHRGCKSTACEGVEQLKELMNSGSLGCAVLGPTCNYATFQMVDAESGLKLKTPIISAGSFGPSCDDTVNLQRLLPPARKISGFFINFWEYKSKIKPEWETAYVYKKQSNTEDCFWYINAMDADSNFLRNIRRTVLRKPDELKKVLTSPRNRTSNLFIMCGSPMDVEEVKSVSKNADSSDILFVLIDLYNDQYYTNTSSLPFMRNVLVLTMPNNRSYVINSDLKDNNTMNDYMAAYHDSVLLVGQVMREIVKKPQSEIQQMEFVNVNFFRNVSFHGKAGNYKLDKHGDRDVNLSVIYTTSDNKYQILFTFDTEYKETKVVEANPSFIWGKRLPDSLPDQGLAFHDIIVIVLAVTVVVVATIAFIFYRQNRRERRVRKRWSFIRSDLITLLENNQFNVVTLKIEDERKNMKFKIRRALYDKKIVILKELEHSDGNFNETQMIELNALKQIDYYNLTKFYGTVKFDQGVFGVFEYGERGSLRYVLNDKVSYPEETFMDWEFKISVMYDIAKVYMLIKSCWDEDPEKRPDFKRVENCLGKIISKIHNQDNESYMDNMIRRLQMYSRNLEHLVEERTALYKAERDRADCLNFMLLPGPVVKSLKETGVVEPELYEEVTIYFSDIVGFTTLCQYSTPMEVVDMLNDIYKGFDSIVDHHDVYKVETIGDAYMVASGLPKRNGNRHAVDICRMALDILAFMGTFQLRHLPGIPVWIRIGVHSGLCAAGVVGIKMPRYCLFGDTVNTASRMESTGHPLRIHVSQPTINILQRTDCKFEYEMRGETYLKGKGTETTYWLTGETGEDYDLPTPPTTENFQRLQQDLAHMILACLERRSRGSIQRKTPLSSQSREEDPDQESEVESESDHPEYLHLATVDNTLSTFL